MSSERVAMTVVRALNKRRSIIIPGGANRFLAFLGIVFPRMTRRVLKSSLFKKMMFEQLNLQLQRLQNDSESERWKCLPEQPYDKGVQKNWQCCSDGGVQSREPAISVQPAPSCQRQLEEANKQLPSF